MRVDLFDFDLPPERIAQEPVEPRDAARLLLVDEGPLREAVVRDLPGLLRPGDLLVLNDTRVLPTRFFGRRGAVPVEVTLVERIDDDAWWALARPGKRLRPGDRVDLAPELTAEVVAKDEEGRVHLRFPLLRGEALLAAMRAHGAMPLPPYIRRPRGGDPRDRALYQTVFARRDGAVAAPTASLHLTEELLARLAAAGIERTFVTLHVGAGTFAPVKAEDTESHRMHAEWCEVPEAAAAAIAAARARGGRIVSVGTTVLRTLESLAAPDGTVRPGSGETRLFITPGYRFRVVDLLLTNFHLPRSTLFMLVCAFSGLERMRAAYAHAIAEGFRFFSYGDACLLTRAHDPA
ncbi:tRNA preQ1(34) S-adenosylmethionine ribosyltransferase-isomerase QueA [Benzoatithermus flavus]|uniref:S-adenosylmethionine:tRNA ribosyltransferase-isomerase n=1 Tax=Benzoatithermus flavus TaxID=3108223 RepID=A0ABU8XPT0_9PROT